MKAGFLDGRMGFLFAVFNAQGTFYRGMKQIYFDSDIDQLPNLQKIEDDLKNERI